MMSHYEDVSPVNEPDLSVVIGLTTGGKEVMLECLGALLPSARGLHVEVIVPYDSRLDHVQDLTTQFPSVSFIDARDQVDAAAHGQSSREHHDILRAIGLNLARGRIISLLEDNGVPGPGWCQMVVNAHYQTSAAAVGGAIENRINRLLNWAVYYCDFGRFQNPVPEGPADFLSDTNVAYKRNALLALHDKWCETYHETSVNWELRRRGECLILNSAIVAHQTRRDLRFSVALRERFVWGRSFAGSRVNEITKGRRLVLACLFWLLPFLLTWRIIYNGLSRRRLGGTLLNAIPLIFLLQTIWAAGELTGYITGRTGGPVRQDETAEQCAASPF